MIDAVKESFVPVWVNIRTERFPDAPGLKDYTWDLVMSDQRSVMNWWYNLFFVRSYVLSPDLATLLNDEEGLLGHITMRGEPYLEMLNASLARWRNRPIPAAVR